MTLTECLDLVAATAECSRYDVTVCEDLLRGRLDVTLPHYVAAGVVDRVHRAILDRGTSGFHVTVRLGNVPAATPVAAGPGPKPDESLRAAPAAVRVGQVWALSEYGLSYTVTRVAMGDHVAHLDGGGVMRLGDDGWPVGGSGWSLTRAAPADTGWVKVGAPCRHVSSGSHGKVIKIGDDGCVYVQWDSGHVVVWMPGDVSSGLEPMVDAPTLPAGAKPITGAQGQVCGYAFDRSLSAEERRHVGEYVKARSPTPYKPADVLRDVAATLSELGATGVIAGDKLAAMSAAVIVQRPDTSPKAVRARNRDVVAGLEPPRWATLFGQRRGPAFDKWQRFLCAFSEYAGTRARPFAIEVDATGTHLAIGGGPPLDVSAEAAVDAWMAERGVR